MTPAELTAAIQRLWPGHGQFAEAARHFSIAGRRMREYTSGDRSVPEWLARDIAAMVDQFPNGMKRADPRITVKILQQQMVAGGWTDNEAAAGILGAALANARAHLDAAVLADLLANP